MNSNGKFDSKKRRVVNLVELGDGELFYIRLDDGKKYLLNGDGCWRCGSTACCFGNMTDENQLKVICEFGFFNEVRCLFLLLLQNQATRLASWLSEKIRGEVCILIEGLVDVFRRTVELVNLKS